MVTIEYATYLEFTKPKVLSFSMMFFIIDTIYNDFKVIYV